MRCINWHVTGCVFLCGCCADLEKIKGYIDAFRYGAPPHAGGGIGQWCSLGCSLFTYSWSAVYSLTLGLQFTHSWSAVYSLTLDLQFTHLLLVCSLLTCCWSVVYSLTLGLQFTHLLLICSLLTYSWSAVDSLTLGLQLTHLLLVCSWLIYLLFNARSVKIAQWYSTPVRHLWS